MGGKDKEISVDLATQLSLLEVGHGDYVNVGGDTGTNDNGFARYRYDATSPLVADGFYVRNGQGGGRFINVDRRAIPVTQTSGTTVNVSFKQNIVLDYTVAATITNLTNGIDGQQVWIRITNGNVTIANNANIDTLLGAPYTPPTTGALLLFRRDAGKWWMVIMVHGVLNGERKDDDDGVEILATANTEVNYDLRPKDNAIVNCQQINGTIAIIPMAPSIRTGLFTLILKNYAGATVIDWSNVQNWAVTGPQPTSPGTSSMAGYVLMQFPNDTWWGVWPPA